MKTPRPGAVVILLFAWLTLAAPVLAGLAAGVKAFEQHDYAKARRHLEPLVTQGDARAAFLVAQIYLHGYGGGQDIPRAIALFRSSATQGNADAQVALAHMILENQVPGEAVPEALGWYAKAAAQGNAESQHDLGRLYQEGRIVPPDPAQAVLWFSRCADLGNHDCQMRLGEAYAEGLGVDKDETRAAGLLRKAADSGNVDAMYGLARMHLDGRGVARDPASAVTLLEHAAKKGQHDAKRELSRFYLKGEHVPQDRSRALFLACELPCDAQSLALIEQAVEHMSAEQLAAATVTAIQFVNEGKYPQAHGPLGALARRGVAAAQFQLGSLLLLAYGKPQNLVEAFKWISLGSAHSPESARALTAKIAGRFQPAEVEAMRQLVARWKPGPREACEQVHPTAVIPGPDVNLPTIVSKAAPVYPERARQAHAEGHVILQVIISTSGDVIDPYVLRSSLIGQGFEEAAIAAVSQWKYRPATTRDGRAIEVFFTLVVEFEFY